MEVIIGTYEEFLLGYKLIINENASFVQSFADKSHAGPLKCLAVHGNFVATGATDDRIFLYDMRSRKQTNIILSHEGTINALAFTPDNSHLLSGGDDGRMIATRQNTWATEGNWKAHKGLAVNQISCHPSGKLALSLGADRVLCTWNLVKGRVAYRTNLKSRSTLGTQPDCLTWSPTGDYFTLCGFRAAEIWSIKSADALVSRKTKEKPICVCWVADELCLVGLESGKILWLEVTEEEGEEDEKQHFTEAHDTRVKVMALHKDTLITISSSGEMKAWQVNINKKNLKLMCTTNIGCRPTCLSILDLTQFGGAFVLKNNDTKEDKQQVNIVPKKTVKPPERGVVTIEYEEDAQDEPEQESSDDDTDSSEPSSSQVQEKSRKRKGNVDKKAQSQTKQNQSKQKGPPLSKKQKNNKNK
ncbi:p21-activated protein kinase-interacting protein 1-like [Bactrocera neohumeralis]|uniref:p21-activated protein kinase-interacting protein 1-like n=1 Tax=Bactrocera neohumeralis TaxID=98809 RepID=UPI002166A23E|nr:p21-activated protein kinase-interacting protein 1-like [Bactrocera neohumeralis]